MTTPLNSLVVSLIVTLYLLLLSSASQLRRSIVHYDAELHGDVFTSAVLDQRTGALYVSDGDSSVRRFTSSLRLEAEYTRNIQTSVCDGDHRTDCRLCLNGTVPITTGDVDDRNGTGIVRLDSTSGQLLVCGGRCGHCSVLNVTVDLEPDQHLQVLDPTSSASYIASRVVGASPVMVFSAQNATEVGNNVTQTSKLFVAGATAFNSEAVSVREQRPTATGFDVVGERFFASDTFGDSYQFTDALDAGDGFIYFVAVRRYERAPRYEMRLVRVCREDTGLDSYAEVKLSCVLQTALTASLNVAVTAHVAPVGADLAWRFQLEPGEPAPGEPAIYLVAERQEPPSDANSSDRWTSGICVYTMRQVRKTDSS